MNKADAYPTKDFFVRMITKDISLEDCLLDLIDNCIDGARRKITASSGHNQPIDSYEGFRTSLSINSIELVVADNCGGISVRDAVDYAYHFGRRPDAPAVAGFPIGLYGIGMKRAVLKVGKEIEIRSSTGTDAFLCKISVKEWLRHDRWEFDLHDTDLTENAGTAIRITDLYSGIAAEFADPTFVNGLTAIVARDYGRFIDKGFQISINDSTVTGHRFAVKQSDDFQPFRDTYEDEGVTVTILAGMAARPPDGNDPTELVEIGYYGWFVLCNDRVVLAADKTESTVWGHEGFARWHPQYYGFMGMVLFHGSDPNLLPWTTTKRNVDESSPLYRRAVKRMKRATQPWIEYTNQRKANLEQAKSIESSAKSVPLFDVKENAAFKVPDPPIALIRVANIGFQKPLSEVRRAGKALGDRNMAYRRVGEKTFEYFMENEVEEGD